MEVTINTAKFAWDSDFKTNKKVWHVKFKDAFCIVEIGGTKCFVKRFEEPPSALQLLLDLKGKPVINIPKVYDFIDVKEDGKNVQYLFSECVEGEILKDYITENKPINTTKISHDILEGLKFINRLGYWFGDFNEENIFYSEKGPFLLIDLDSCWPNDVFPDPDSGKQGGLPGAAQEHAYVVMLFYREILNKPEFLFHDIKGKNLNCLQLLALLAKLQSFLDNKKTNPKTTYINKRLYKDLHFFLLNKNELYCKSIFQKALADQLSYNLLSEYCKFLTGENKTPVNNDLPVIEYFKASEYNIFLRSTTTLSWSVKNATAVTLTANGDPLLESVPVESLLGVRPTKPETYSLSAVSKTGGKVIKTIQIDVKQVPMPVIKRFEASKLKVKKGQTVVLSWLVENTSQVLLNNTKFNLNIMGATVNPVKKTTYMLVAENLAGEKTDKQIDIEIVSHIWRWIITIIILLILIVAYLASQH